MSLLDDLLTSAIKSSYEKNKRKESVPSILGALKDPQFLQDMKRGVLDSVNRGAVASTIGGPVDLATMLMRPLGYNVEKPTGGSEWVGDKMQQLGLLGDTRNPIAEALASVAVPGAMAKVAPKVFQAEQAAIQNAKIAGPLSDGKFATQRGVFGGLNAKTADKAKLSQAEQMLNKGVDPAQVWKETGWGRGPDGKWRFEIPDDAAKFNRGGIEKMYSYGYRPQDQIFKHDELHAAYPDSGKIQTTYTSGDVADIAGKYGAHYNGDENLISLGVPRKGADLEKAKSINLHELQHAIQQREGFARGGSPEGLKEALANDAFALRKQARELDSSAWRNDPLGPAELLKPGARQKALALEKEAGKLNSWVNRIDEFGDNFAHDAYKHLGGEAEARLVQSRMNLTPEERAAQYPWNADYFKQQTGVGLDDLIHRFDGGEAKSVGFQYPQDAALETARQNGVKMLGLPENNTALDRAKALGFEDVLHGTSADIQQVNTQGRRYVNPFYTTASNSPAEIEFANQFANTKPEMGAATVYPLKVRKSAVIDTRESVPQELLDAAEESYSSLNIGEKGLPTWGNVNNWATEAKNKGLQGVLLDERPQLNSIAVLDPSIVRSRFAAFDPARVNENDLLAGAMPFGLLLDPENRAKLGLQ